MVQPWYERLSPQDRAFLVFDGPRTPMHVAALMVLEATSLRTLAGGVDIARVRRHVAAQLHHLPRYRQRLLALPLSQYPAWVDDDGFDIDYHVRHLRVPAPGTDDQLRDLTGALMSQPLDASRPLWEIWLIEGLADDRFALFLKIHHCLVDGTSGAALLAVLLSPTPEVAPNVAPAWTPRPTPSATELLRDELRRSRSAAFDAATRTGRLLARGVDVGERVRDAWSGLRDTALLAWQRPDPTPLNRPVGTARRCDWLRIDLAQAKAIKTRRGGTVNDVVVATVTGALREFLARRGVEVDRLQLRATVPVNRRSEAERGPSGNHVSAWFMHLPIGESAPLRRYAAVRAHTERMKQSSQAGLIEALADAAAWVDPLHVLGLRLAAWLSPYNLIITNVVGPPIPLYFLGARMLGAYPFAPLFHNQGLAVAAFGYAGELCLGCTADRALVPDLAEFTDALRRSFIALAAAAARGSAPARRLEVVRTVAKRRPAQRPIRVVRGAGAHARPS